VGQIGNHFAQAGVFPPTASTSQHPQILKWHHRDPSELKRVDVRKAPEFKNWWARRRSGFSVVAFGN